MTSKKDKETGSLLTTAMVFGGIIGGALGLLVGYIAGKGWV